MIKLIGTMVFIMAVIAAFAGIMFTQGQKHPNAQYVLTKESGTFNSVSKEVLDFGDVYTLYIKSNENKITKKEIIVYKSERKMKGMVKLTIVKNSTEENNYIFDFNKNGWHVYDTDYNNNIILSLNDKTKILQKKH